jgi:hypothetical protein
MLHSLQIQLAIGSKVQRLRRIEADDTVAAGDADDNKASKRRSCDVQLAGSIHLLKRYRHSSEVAAEAGDCVHQARNNRGPAEKI